MNHPVVIVGGGLAGLSAALHLRDAGVAVRVCDASDDVGGRVRTDVVDGYTLDRGFQVLLEAYPEVRAQLDLDALATWPFEAGARVRRGGRFVDVVDPFRRPGAAMRSLGEGVGGLGDKLRVLGLRRDACAGALDDLFERPDLDTRTTLERAGFSGEMIDAFFRPWLSGVFLEPHLATSRRMLDFVFRMFAEGPASLPSHGMGEIPRQLARRLPPGTVRTRCRVERVAPDEVVLSSGERVSASAVVLATEGPAAAALLGEAQPFEGVGVTCLYFAAEQDPVGAPVLVLDGEGTGPVNNLVVPSAVCPAYAPAGRALISASVLGTGRGDGLEAAVRAQLRGWFGTGVDGWRHLRTYEIPYALPDQRPPLTPARRIEAHDGVYVCGDHVTHGSLQGALASGRLAAEAVVRDRRAAPAAV